MLPLLALLVVLLSAVDHWTTFLCLRAPVAGWHVVEANPIADWLFLRLGLVPGLALDSAVTLLALAFLMRTRIVPHPVKLAFLGVVAAGTAWAVANNLEALRQLGLPLTRVG
jgi:hypothetical protein